MEKLSPNNYYRFLPGNNCLELAFGLHFYELDGLSYSRFGC
jgi:hypothetical protein